MRFSSKTSLVYGRKQICILDAQENGGTTWFSAETSALRMDSITCIIGIACIIVITCITHIDML